MREGCYPVKRRKHIICMQDEGPWGNRIFKTKPSKVWSILKTVLCEAENQLQDDDVLWFQPQPMIYETIRTVLSVSWSRQGELPVSTSTGRTLLNTESNFTHLTTQVRQPGWRQFRTEQLICEGKWRKWFMWKDGSAERWKLLTATKEELKLHRCGRREENSYHGNRRESIGS